MDDLLVLLLQKVVYTCAKDHQYTDADSDLIASVGMSYLPRFTSATKLDAYDLISIMEDGVIEAIKASEKISFEDASVFATKIAANVTAYLNGEKVQICKTFERVSLDEKKA